MDRLKTSEGFPHYIRSTRARDVDNRKGLQRSSDGSLWRRSGMRCCVVAGERSAAARNGLVARSGRFSPALHMIGAIQPTILRAGGEQLQRSSRDVLTGIEPAAPLRQYAGGCMSGRRSRDEGARTERAIVRVLKVSGIDA